MVHTSIYFVQEPLTRRIRNVQSDSIVALDLDTGEVKWSTRLGPLDVFLGRLPAAGKAFDGHCDSHATADNHSLD